MGVGVWMAVILGSTRDHGVAAGAQMEGRQRILLFVVLFVNLSTS